MTNFWLSFRSPRLRFTLHQPWWIVGQTADSITVCVAIQAEDRKAAKMVVLQAFDQPPELVWSFCTEMPPHWSPFTARFARACWMKWDLLA